jgi:hypothetical protein
MSTRGRPRKERYARLMGGFWRNKKVRRLSLEARGLLATAWSYAADQATDGRVPLELLEAWAGKRHAKLMSELAAFLVVVDDLDAQAHDWTEVNISAAEWDRRLEKDRSRKRDGADFPHGNPPDIPTGNPATFHAPAQTKTKTKTKSPLEGQEEHEGAEAPNLAERVRERAARYPAGLVEEARLACALSRKNGRMAESVWLTTLERLEAFPTAAVVEAMRVFVERHADGDKSEAYLVAIARGKARGAPGHRAPSVIDPERAAESQRHALALFDGLEPDEFRGEDFREAVAE